MTDKKRIINILLYIIPPVLVMGVLLVLFSANGFYPYGEKSLVWGDLRQQVVPLMINFKDILDGKSSMFMSFENAGGMNFWGVFFYYLSNPFTFLVKFVEKENIILFMNIIVMLKLMTASATAMVYFRKCHEKLDGGIAVALSVMYAFCGYGLMYYQNNVWLDMMYLFPLLMLSLNLLTKKQKVLPYIITITAMVIVNYYISFMIVVFLFIFFGLYVFRNKKEITAPVCIKFIIGSGIGVFLSAFVWLPSFLQYKSSARGASVIETIASSKFITSYETILTLIYCSAFVMVVVLINLFSNRQRDRELQGYLYLFALMLIPIFIEPINKMWHTGTYMSFPGRYAFITVFVGLICCAYMLSGKQELKSTGKILATLFIPAVLVVLLGTFASRFITDNVDTINKFVRTLWGDQNSWLKVTQLFIVFAVFYGAIYLLYKKGLVIKDYFVILLCAVTLIEGYSYSRVYIAEAGKVWEGNVQSQQNVLAMVDQIQDDSFYRVKTSSKLFDYNMVGTLGYPSISHYTSLTNQDYMFTMKRLGYTSVWMEAGSCGGTSLTDSILSIGYEITPSHNANGQVYADLNYAINKLPNKSGLGIVTSRDLSDKEEIPEELERAEVQQYIYSSLYNDNTIVQRYNPEYTSDELVMTGEYDLSGSGYLYYNCYVQDRQELYFDCFDEMTTKLSEPVYDSFRVVVNGSVVEQSYPYNKNNGVLYLGEFENQQVSVQVDLLKSVNCASFGVFGIRSDVLADTVGSSKSVNFQRDKGSLYGTYNAEAGESCFLAVPYDTGYNIKINGHKVDYQKALSAFIYFPLEEGENEITVTFTPNGLVLSIVLTVIGVALLVLYLKFGKKLVVSDKIENGAVYLLGTMGILMIIFIYIAPFLLNIMASKN